MKELNIIKRNGDLVNFDKIKIVLAIEKAMMECDQVDSKVSKQIADDIENSIRQRGIQGDCTVEEVQDLVEMKLMELMPTVAKKYILYREERSKVRNRPTVESKEYVFLTSEFVSQYKHKPEPFKNELGKFVYYRTYSRAIPEEHRRERWYETVARVVEFNLGLHLKALRNNNKSITSEKMDELKQEAMEIYDLMFNLKLFPSGRTLFIGGTKSSEDLSISNFNCSFVTIDEFVKFSEMFYLLMLGTGVGLSLQKEYTDKLPKIRTDVEFVHRQYEPVVKNKRTEFTQIKELSKDTLEIIIGDSRFGWIESMRFLFDILTEKNYQDVKMIVFNYDNIRGIGEPLKTFGGTSSGHTSIQTMYSKIEKVIKRRNDKQWNKLKTVDCLDIATVIAENVISGSIRRSALIVFCDPDDDEVREAKSNLYYIDDSGNWQANQEILNRMLSNNTIIYKQKPTREELHVHFELLKVTGEPGFANLEEMKRRHPDVKGANPLNLKNVD